MVMAEMGQWEDAHLLEAQPVSTQQSRGGFRRVAVVLFCAALLAAAAGAAGPLASRRAMTSRGAALLVAAAKGNGGRKGKSAAKALPAPEPEGEVLEAPELSELSDVSNIEPAELDNFEHKLKNLPKSGKGRSPPPEITGMTADDWTMVYSNTNVLRGRRSDPSSLDHHSWLFLLLPPKHKYAECIFPEQKTHYEVTVTQDEKYSKAAQIGSQNAFGKISSPFVSASFEYSGMGQHVFAGMGSTVITHQKFMAPVVTLKLEPGIHVRRYAGDSGKFAVNPKFAKLAGQLVQKHNGSCSSLREAWKSEVGRRFGEIYAASVKIGVGADRTVTKVMRSSQDLAFAQKTVKAAVGGSIPPYMIGGEVGGGASSSGQTEDGHRSSEQSETWTCFTGSGEKCDDPTTVSDYRSHPNSWRVLAVDKFLPVTDLLPPRVVDQLNEVCRHEWAFSRAYPNGCTYTGPLKDGLPSGQGRCLKGDKVWGDIVYEGEFKDGLRSGQGRSSDSTRVFEGVFRNDRPNGQGKLATKDGASFSGEWRDGQLNGQGKVSVPVVEPFLELDGQFKNGSFVSGQYKTTMNNGHVVNRVDGQFKEQHLVSGHGRVEYYLRPGPGISGHVVYEGELKGFPEGGDFHGFPNGLGKLTNENGTVEEGLWEATKAGSFRLVRAKATPHR